MSTGGPPRVAIFVAAMLASGGVVGTAVIVEAADVVEAVAVVEGAVVTEAATAGLAGGTTAGSGWGIAGWLLADDASEAATAAVFVSSVVVAVFVSLGVVAVSTAGATSGTGGVSATGICAGTTSGFGVSILGFGVSIAGVSAGFDAAT
jgi:hypothetical protein